MRHGQDSHQVVSGSVNETVGIPLEDVTACPRFVTRPAEWRRDDLLDGVVEIGKKALLGGGALFSVPVAGFLDLPGGFGMENQSSGHGARA